MESLSRFPRKLVQLPSSSQEGRIILFSLRIFLVWMSSGCCSVQLLVNNLPFSSVSFLFLTFQPHHVLREKKITQHFYVYSREWKGFLLLFYLPKRTQVRKWYFSTQLVNFEEMSKFQNSWTNWLNDYPSTFHLHSPIVNMLSHYFFFCVCFLLNC